MRRLASSLAPLFGLVVLGAPCGCAGQGRQEVSGEVLLKGKPVEDGVILFAPLDGQGTGDGAQIVRGQYVIPKAKGLTPGKYKVSIYAGDGRSGTGDASPDSPHARRRPGKERAPPEYNERSTLVKEITRGGPNKFDFSIP